MLDHINNPFEQYAKNEKRDTVAAQLTANENTLVGLEDQLKTFHHASNQAKAIRKAIATAKEVIADAKAQLNNDPELKRSYSARWLAFEILADMDDGIAYFRGQVARYVADLTEAEDKSYWMRRYSDDLISNEYKLKWLLITRKAIGENTKLQNILEMIAWGLKEHATSEIYNHARDVLNNRPGDQLVNGSELDALMDITNGTFGYRSLMHYQIASDKYVSIENDEE